MTTTHQIGKPISGGEIWQGAKDLRAFLSSKSDEIESARRLTPEVVNAMHDKGLFRLNMPEIWGGPELSSMEQVEIIEEVSQGDASAGWCLMIGCDSGLYSGYLEDSVARELYPRLDMVQAGWVYPVGQLHEASDGYRLKKAQWAFGSGSTHADLIAAGCIVFKDGELKLRDNGEPDTRVVIAKREQWEVLDTWYTTGLCGTGSNDYTIIGDEMFVPREHTFSWNEFDTEPRREGLLWRKPDTLLRKMPGIPLGVARAAIDFSIDTLKDKVEIPSQKAYRDIPRVQSAIAEAEMRLGAARSYVFSSLEVQWQKIEQGKALSKKERVDVWASRLNAFQTARDVVRLLYDTVGGSAIYANSLQKKRPLDRALRDTQTMCQHLVGQYKTLEMSGALLLGESDTSPHVML